MINNQLNKMKEGGTIKITSKPTNCSVFIDSFYKGNTPIVVSNLSVGNEHRLKMISLESNLKPFYYVFTFESTNSQFQIDAELKNYEGATDLEKNLSWLAVYSTWGLSIGLLGFNMYNHYMQNYYWDKKFNATNLIEQNLFNTKSDEYKSAYESSLTYFMVSAILAGWFTAYGLSKEEIYLGFDYNLPKKESMASLAIRF